MVDRCVCCGDIIPEGRMVCIRCEKTPTFIPRKDRKKDKTDLIDANNCVSAQKKQ